MVGGSVVSLKLFGVGVLQGEALLVFTRNAALLATSMPQEAVKKLIVPLLVRAADQGGDCHQLVVHSIADDPQLSDGTTAPSLARHLMASVVLQVTRRPRRRW